MESQSGPVQGSVSPQQAYPQRKLKARVDVWPGRWGAIAIGALIIFAACSLELATLDLRTPPLQKVVIDKDGRFTMPQPPKADRVVVTLETAIKGLSELGFALVIAGVIANLIEIRAQSLHIKSIETARDQIENDIRRYLKIMERRFRNGLETLQYEKNILLRNVIHGVLQLRYDQEYVKAVLETSFSSGIIREDYAIDIMLESYSEEEQRVSQVDLSKYFKLTCRVRYRVKNVDLQPRKLATRYAIPFVPGLESFAGLTALSIGGKKFDSEEIDAITSRDEEREEFMCLLSAELEPGAPPIEIESTAVMIKDMSDTEAFGFLFPTLRASFRISSDLPNLWVGCNERSSTKMQRRSPESEKRRGEWVIPGAILPFNSVVFWWRPQKPAILTNLQQNASSSVNEPNANNGLENGEPNA